MCSNACNFFITETALYFEITTVKLKVSLLLNVSLRIRPLTFINEALRLLDSPFTASTASP